VQRIACRYIIEYKRGRESEQRYGCAQQEKEQSIEAEQGIEVGKGRGDVEM
jgi:hypothetical protein